MAAGIIAGMMRAAGQALKNISKISCGDIDAGGRQQQGYDEADSAKYGNGFERLDLG
jgi:hypothetical protein